jgi:hypothetical protein
MAESLIAVSTDQPLSDIVVRIVSIDVPGLGDIATRAAAIEDARNAAAHAAEAARHDAAEYARALAKAGVPVRDTADLLHVSPQRVSQLAAARYAGVPAANCPGSRLWMDDAALGDSGIP